MARCCGHAGLRLALGRGIVSQTRNRVAERRALGAAAVREAPGVLDRVLRSEDRVALDERGEAQRDAEGT